MKRLKYNHFMALLILVIFMSVSIVQCDSKLTIPQTFYKNNIFTQFPTIKSNQFYLSNTQPTLAIGTNIYNPWSDTVKSSSINSNNLIPVSNPVLWKPAPITTLPLNTYSSGQTIPSSQYKPGPNVPSAQLNTYSKYDNGGTISVKKGNTIHVRLYEEPQSGSTWNMITGNGLQITGDRFYPYKNTGGLVKKELLGGEHEWDILAVGTGTYRVKGELKESGGSKVYDTFELTVNVVE